MEIVYVFIGRLPHYIVDTVHQARTWSDGKITLICDDVESPYLAEVAKYTVTVINANLLMDSQFITVANNNIHKFCIAHKLGDRRLLFIRSFERFFILQKYMEITGAQNILFLELDMLIYFKPEDLLPIISQREITFTHTEKPMKCSAFCYIRSLDILSDLNRYFLQYIENPENKDNISEMQAIWKWLDVPGIRDRVWMLPGLWKDEKYTSDVWENYDAFQQTLFDSLGIAIAIDGPDATHREEWERRGRVWWGCDVNYNAYPHTWKDVDGKRVVYFTDPIGQEHRVQCLHVHNKNLPVFLSTPRV